MLYDEIMTGKEFDRLDYDLWRAREGDNPNGMGDYPRRMIVLKEETDEQKKKRNIQGSNKPNQNNDNRGQR